MVFLLKQKHNEVAPAQHEVACVYRNVNITTDNNHLLMLLMQDIAKKHGLRCLLHEKPFDGVNGSGNIITGQLSQIPVLIYLIQDRTQVKIYLS